MAAVVFTVDWESKSGIAPIPNEEIAEAAAGNPDVLIPFASVDPATRRRGTHPAPGHGARREGVQVPPEPPGVLPERPQRLPLRGHRGGRAPGALPQRPQRYRDGRPRAAAGSASSTRTRCASTTSRPTSPSSRSCSRTRRSLAGRGDLRLSPQAERLDRPVGWSPVLPTAARPVREHATSGEGALRLGLPAHTPDRWLDDLAQAPFKDEVRPLILKENAARLLGLGPA